jgi:hypothetical protein
MKPIIRQRCPRSADHDRRSRVVSRDWRRVRQPRHRQSQARTNTSVARPTRLVTTNTVEGYYSIFKRGMKGIYQHCAEKHLHRYLAEFDFRYSNRVKLGVNDVARADRALKGAVGKRLTYQTTAN